MPGNGTPCKQYTDVSNLLVFVQDLWLHITLRDIDNCFQKALGSKEEDVCLHLVVKSSPQFLCHVPFPMPMGSRGINSVNCSNAVLRVPLQQLEKAVVFIEVTTPPSIT